MYPNCVEIKECTRKGMLNIFVIRTADWAVCFLGGNGKYQMDGTI
jgi:hypothetical protein